MEYIRSITVKMEVDTNKRTHVLDVECDTLEVAQRSVADFIEAVSES
jgi:hypothetical protein